MTWDGVHLLEVARRGYTTEQVVLFSISHSFTNSKRTVLPIWPSCNARLAEPGIFPWPAGLGESGGVVVAPVPLNAMRAGLGGRCCKLHVDAGRGCSIICLDVGGTTEMEYTSCGLEKVRLFHCH